MVICLERGADLHMAQLMSLPLTVSCFSKIQIGFTFLVPAHLVVPDKGPLNRCVCSSVMTCCQLFITGVMCIALHRAFATGQAPAPRYHHSAVMYQGSMFIFGKVAIYTIHQTISLALIDLTTLEKTATVGCWNGYGMVICLE